MAGELSGLEIPQDYFLITPNILKWKGKYIDNGILSNTTRLSKPICWRDRIFHSVEAIYVAEKNPFCSIDGKPFIDHVVEHCERHGVHQVKRLGLPKVRGGLIDPRPDWDYIRIGVMLSANALKYFPGSSESDWLASIDQSRLVEYNNWGDRYWGAVVTKDNARARGRNILGKALTIIQQRLLDNRPIQYIPEHTWRDAQRYVIKQYTSDV